MRTLRFFVLLAACAAVSSAAQAQSFPGRTGHWEATVAGGGQDPMKLDFCLNDDTWKTALNTNKTCTISNFNSGLSSISYHLTCTIGKGGKMEGDTKLTFEGKEHMTGTGTFHGSVNGKPLPDSQTKVDYVWKSSSCTGQEMNLRAEKAREQQH